MVTHCKLLALILLLATPAWPQQKGLMSLAVTVPPTGHSVTLTWDASACLDQSGNTIACPANLDYSVYRSRTSGGGGKCLNGVCGAYCCRLASTTSGALTYTDASVAPGQTYYYAVTAHLPPCAANQTTPCGESGTSKEVQAMIPPEARKKKHWF